MRAGFASPSRNIVCNVGYDRPKGGTADVTCSVLSLARAARGQRDWAMRTTGRVTVYWIQANIATEVPVLRYGRAFSWHGIRCVSRTSGVTCTNRSRHGFSLARAKQRVF